MTIKKTKTVANKLVKLGKLSLNMADCNADTLSDWINNPWNNAMTAPSYSIPNAVLWVIGENAFHMMFSQILMAMNSEVPELPIPYPFDKSSSTIIIKIAENTS